MGGASRNERKRRQDAAARRLAAAGIQVPQKRSNPSLMIVIAVVVVAVLVGGIVLYMRSSSSGTVTPTYTATASGAVVTAGTGKPSIDVYEDFLCPNCEIFEKTYGDEIVTALNEGKLTVRYHSIAILDSRSNPAGLLDPAANAALCAVPAGIYPAYHQKLFANQPVRGQRGPDRRPARAVRHRPGREGRLRVLRHGREERLRRHRRDPEGRRRPGPADRRAVRHAHRRRQRRR